MTSLSEIDLDAVVREIVGLRGRDYVPVLVRDAYLRHSHLPREGLHRRRVQRMAVVVDALAHRHAMTDEPLVDAVDYLGLDVLERTVDERVCVMLRKGVVEEPRDGHRKHEGGEYAQDEL